MAEDQVGPLWYDVPAGRMSKIRVGGGPPKTGGFYVTANENEIDRNYTHQGVQALHVSPTIYQMLPYLSSQAVYGLMDALIQRQQGLTPDRRTVDYTFDEDAGAPTGRR